MNPNLYASKLNPNAENEHNHWNNKWNKLDNKNQSPDAIAYSFMKCIYDGTNFAAGSSKTKMPAIDEMTPSIPIVRGFNFV